MCALMKKLKPCDPNFSEAEKCLTAYGLNAQCVRTAREGANLPKIG